MESNVNTVSEIYMADSSVENKENQCVNKDKKTKEARGGDRNSKKLFMRKLGVQSKIEDQPQGESL